MPISYRFIGRDGAGAPGVEAAQVRFGIPAVGGWASIMADPSLAMSALRRAGELYGRFRPIFEEKGKELHLVAPADCGFDTLAAMYIVRRVLDGRTGREAALARLTPLAAYATRERLGHLIWCPLERRLSSVVIAARRRGRSQDADGFFRLFEDATRRIDERSLNPACDSVLDGVEEWRPELELLASDRTAFQRDRAGARRELALWESSSGLRLMETLLVDEPRSILCVRWAWEEGFPLVVMHSRGQHVLAAVPWLGRPITLVRLAELLQETDGRKVWNIPVDGGADGEWGDAGVTSARDESRLELEAIEELIRSQWVEALIAGPVLISDIPLRGGKDAIPDLEISTGQLLTERANQAAISSAGARAPVSGLPEVRTGYCRLARAPLRSDLRFEVSPELGTRLAELMWPLIRPGASAFRPSDVRLIDGVVSVSSGAGIVFAYPAEAESLVDHADQMLREASALASDAASERSENLHRASRPQREELLRRLAEVRSCQQEPGAELIRPLIDTMLPPGAWDQYRTLWNMQHHAWNEREQGLRLDELRSGVETVGALVIGLLMALVSARFVQPMFAGAEGVFWAAMAATVGFIAGAGALLARASDLWAKPNLRPVSIILLLVFWGPALVAMFR